MQEAIEREFEALKDIKRRSSTQGGPGSLRLDPDLPAESAPSTTSPLSPQAWTEPSKGEAPAPRLNRAPSAKGSDAGRTSQDGEDGNGAGGDDPFQLFWVPAHLHPELAPSEFRAFLKEHAHGPASEENAAVTMGSPPGMRRSSSTVSELGRKRSMLSRQYKPRANDGVEEERVVPSRKKSVFMNEGKQLTISDLQKLEELADEASRSEDPTKLRRMLRRSMSLNTGPSVLDQMDDVNDTQDDADAPIIVPPPNQILRRTARTKIRKPNLSGDGGGHRFTSTRRKSAGGRTQSVDNILSPTDGSSSGHSNEKEDNLPPLPSLRKPKVEQEEAYTDRRLTYTEETSIFDAYADTAEEDKATSPVATSPPPIISLQPLSTALISEPEPRIEVTPSSSAPAPGEPQEQPDQTAVPILYQPQPQKRISPQQQQVLQQDQQPSRTPSPDSSAVGHEIVRPDSRSSITSEAPSHASSSSALVPEKRKDKDKKSLWRKVGGSSNDKQHKKSGKDKEREKEKEKESAGFFNSLFGGGKKKQDEVPPSNLGGGAGPATAAALLGVSKSKQPTSPTLSPQLGNPYARYPIHVERAVYRLSHIKLANPRRPLYEQVLISNLMFWYLGVINKANQPPQGQAQGGQGQGQNAQAQKGQNGGQQGQGQGNAQEAEMNQAQASAERERQMERERQEREQREREERERAERERMEASQKREPKRGSLTKPPPAGTGGGGRRAEMPVKGPQYHIQSQALEQEYGGGNSPVRTGSAPPPSMQGQGFGGPGYGQRAQPGRNGGPVESGQLKQRQEQQAYGQPNNYYGRSGSLDMGSGGSANSSLPPGAMAPLSNTEQLWLASQNAYGSSQQAQYDQNTDWSNPSGHSQSPPRERQEQYGYTSGGDWRSEQTNGAKTPMRSLSANAVAPNLTNNNYGHYGQFGQHQHHHHHHQHHGGTNHSETHQNALKKKPYSAHAAPAHGHQRVSEDEDVPLAMWQQRKK